MLKETLLCIGLSCMLLAVPVNAEIFKEKNATMTVYKGEMVWCTFGNEKHANPICNSLELKNNPALIDQFLQFLEYGMVLDDD